MVEITVAPGVASRWQGETVLAVCLLGRCRGASVGPTFATAVADLISELAGASADEDAGLAAMRATFRAMPDMDPTRYRPASESLFRRVASKGFFSIHPLVDMNNLLSIRHRVPLGIYDRDRLMCTQWIYRLGGPGEQYTTITGQQKNAAGKLVLADADGVFGSPVADAGRAPIGPETDRVMVVAFLPFNTPILQADKLGQAIESAFVNEFGAEPQGRQVVPANGPPVAPVAR